MNLKFPLLTAIVVSLFFISCSTDKKITAANNSWVGAPEQRLIESWGPPARTESNGGAGQILVYSRQVYNAYFNSTFYQNTMFFVKSDGIIYHWLVQRGQVPPQQINMSVYHY